MRLACRPDSSANTPSYSALHFLARLKRYPLTEAERADLIQSIEGCTSPHDHAAARRGIERMCEHYLRPVGFGY
jgi:hypothetical protein